MTIVMLCSDIVVYGLSEVSQDIDIIIVFIWMFSIILWIGCGVGVFTIEFPCIGFLLLVVWMVLHFVIGITMPWITVLNDKQQWCIIVDWLLMGVIISYLTWVACRE